MSMLPILLPISRLSTDPHQRHAQLRDYFCDKDAVACVQGNQWLLELGWSNEAERYVDPRLDEGLAWWGLVEYREIAIARKRRGRLLLTLNDTWTLESWSQWLQKQPGRSHADVVVLHVDDHKDVGSPRLFQQGEGWCDPISGKVVALDQPDSVTQAIESGALGMGSFLTPFLHFAPGADVRHLCQAPKCVTTVDSVVKPVWINDTLLVPSMQRPAIKLVQDATGVGPGRYRFTNDLETWLEDVALCGKDILLHIDMDYFCNRYDGDSDFIENPGPLDIPLERVLARIDKLSAALQRHQLIERLVDITIAFSPGFFPAEYWAPTCDRLLIGLGEVPWHD
ncbi:hypothetical protein [Vreelandella salicampi]|uniref:Uncharacterized protein n=1 Tax=Vreelandella salicampi TaxID=1449798 RepID=A0A7Z0LKM5_9GAMM|nr:hypothetical protein [Halomonas salicampi]NYS60695.1 hypothetical protein [Halomonas salicampi]